MNRTTLSLPDALAGTFPGNVSKGVKKAQAKIHAMYNMTENKFARRYVCLDLLCFDRERGSFVQTKGFIHIILYFIGVHEIATLCWSFAFQKDEKTIEFLLLFS